MQEVISRLKSPVVIAQIIGTIVGVVVFFWPNQAEAVQVVSGALVAILNILAGLNNPTDKSNF